MNISEEWLNNADNWWADALEGATAHLLPQQPSIYFRNWFQAPPFAWHVSSFSLPSSVLPPFALLPVSISTHWAHSFRPILQDSLQVSSNWRSFEASPKNPAPIQFISDLILRRVGRGETRSIKRLPILGMDPTTDWIGPVRVILWDLILTDPSCHSFFVISMIGRSFS